MRSVWLEGPARLPLMPVRMLLIPVCHGFNFLSSIKSHSFSFLSNFSYFFTYIFVMASILEREAKNSDEAGIISGILWKRLEKGMPLQVDATFLYTIGKGSDQLTTADLAHNEPYNTYVNKGLPPGPIGNPGVSMVLAALHPVDSSYYYYLHDPNGHVHFAKTYSEHLANKKKYLK